MTTILDPQNKLDYSEQPQGKLSLIQLKQDWTCTPDLKVHYQRPKLALLLEKGYFFYPQIYFYSDKGIKTIDFNLTCDGEDIVSSVADLGQSYLNERQILQLSRSFLVGCVVNKVDGLCAFYRDFMFVFLVWINLIIKSEVNQKFGQIQSDYFGIVYLAEKDPRSLTPGQEAMEAKIRQDFKGRIPTFEESPTNVCWLI